MDLDKWLKTDGGDTVEVVGLGMCYIRPLTAAELSTVKKKAAVQAAVLRVDEETAATLEMCAATVLDPEKHEALFTAAQLAEVPMARLTPVIEAVGRVNGFDTDIEELAGKLPKMVNA